jgi:ribosome-associated protein
MTLHSDSFPQAHPDDESGLPSKSSRKRAMHALQELGAQLVALSSEQLKKMPLSDTLFSAIAEAQRFTRKDEALRRQMQYVGKLMRNVDPEPIQARLDALRGLSASEIARQHRLEQLRDALLADEKTIERIVRDWPGVDIQHLRTLRRNALKEREQQRPPRAYREIFRVLRELDTDTASAGDEGSESDVSTNP